MVETLQDMSLQAETEDLIEEPSLAEAAVSAAASAEDAEAQGEPSEPSAEELEIARDLVRSARARGVAMTGPEGMLKALTKTVIETALDEEMTEHLGYGKHEATGRGSGNSRNGTRTKTVLTETVGDVEVEVPRDRDGSFTPAIVAKRQRRLGGVDTIVLSLIAKGLTTGEVSAHFEEIYGASLAKDTISRITDRVVTEMAEWMARPLEKVYAAVFIDAIYVKVRDGQVANRPFYAAIGVDLAGHNESPRVRPEPPRNAGRFRVHRDVPVDLAHRVGLSDQPGVDPVPGAVDREPLVPLPRGLPRPGRVRKVTPRDPGPEPVHDRLDHLPVIPERPTPLTIRRGHQRLDPSH